MQDLDRRSLSTKVRDSYELSGQRSEALRPRLLPRAPATSCPPRAKIAYSPGLPPPGYAAARDRLPEKRDGAIRVADLDSAETEEVSACTVPPGICRERALVASSTCGLADPRAVRALRV